MARVSFSSLIEEITGKLAGSVFQDSYQGFQIRTRVTPRNPQTFFQQLRRGEFGYLSQLWRDLSSTERDSFISGAPSGVSGLQWFITCNVNLSLIDIAPISTFVGSSSPATMDMAIVEFFTESFLVNVPSGTTTVPAGTTLLLYSTYLKGEQKIFTNPSQYSPIAAFDEGTDMSIAKDVTADFIARFGQITPDQRCCIKSALINKSNGLRTDGAVSCANTSVMPVYYTPIFSLSAGNVIAATGAHTILTFDCPEAYALQQPGYLLIRLSVIIGDNTKVSQIAISTDYADWFTIDPLQNNLLQVELKVSLGYGYGAYVAQKWGYTGDYMNAGEVIDSDWPYNPPYNIYLRCSQSAANNVYVEQMSIDYINPGLTQATPS